VIGTMLVCVVGGLFFDRPLQPLSLNVTPAEAAPLTGH
jgi:hypothetical protein